MQNINLLSKDSHTIPLYIFKNSSNTTKGIIQIVHGMCEHHEYYQDFINYFNKQGYDIYIHDQRGHGQAVTNLDDLGYITDQDGHLKLMYDVITVTEYIQSIEPDCKIILIGHSMGAMVAQSTAMYCHQNNNDYYSHLLLTGTPGASPGWQIFFGKLLIKLFIKFQKKHKRDINLVSNFIIRYGFNFEFRKEKKLFAWTTRDNIWLDKFLSDERAGFIPKNQFWLDILHMLETIKNDNKIKNLITSMPIVFLDGARDPVNHKTKLTKKLIKKLNQLKINNTKHIVYPDTRHHLFIEINRDQFFADVLELIKS